MIAALLVAASAAASAQAPMQYTFDYGTGTATDMSAATVLLGDDAGYDDVVTPVTPIGFTFYYQGTPYTEFSASSNGLMGLGSTPVTTQWGNVLKGSSSYPIIANYWDDLFLDTDPSGVTGGDAGIRSTVTGAPGSRVLTVEWKARRYPINSGPGEIPYSFQTRLYEGTNAIEFYYDGMSTVYGTSGSIGLALDTGRFISVTPGWGDPLSAPTVSTTVPNDTIQLQGTIARLPQGTLYRFTPIVMAQFTSNGSPVGPGSSLFTLMQSCVGESSITLPLTVTNTGLFALNINGFDLFEVDTADLQGPMALRRDAFGNPIPTTDYIVSDVPGTAPMGSNVGATFPDTIAAGETRTYYVTFVGQIPGRRIARAFIRTNANTFSGADTSDVLTQGLLPVELVGQAIGSRLASNLEGSRLRTLVFPDTRAGDTVVRTLTVVNAGACELRINRRRLRIFSGDVNEYRLLSVFPGTPVDAVRDDYMIAPGDTGTITVAFMPVRSGTRMATVFLLTNDSTIGIPGITERGSWYLDLHGRGRAGLDARDLVLNPVVIGSFTNGIARIENTSITAVDIARIYFEGLDSAEFLADAIAGWPTLPTRVVPGQVLPLGVRLTPAAGSQPGVRRTTLVIVTTTGDTLRIRVRGEAGVQQLVVTPTSLFEDVNIPVGSLARRLVTITNNGTLPVRLTSVTITGPDSINYRMGPLPRRDLDPGQSEFLEITFAPVLTGQSSAQLEIAHTGGPTEVVQLGGVANRVRRDPVDPVGDTRINDVLPTPGDIRRTEQPTLR